MSAQRMREGEVQKPGGKWRRWRNVPVRGACLICWLTCINFRKSRRHDAQHADEDRQRQSQRRRRRGRRRWWRSRAELSFNQRTFDFTLRLVRHQTNPNRSALQPSDHLNGHPLRLISGMWLSAQRLKVRLVPPHRDYLADDVDDDDDDDGDGDGDGDGWGWQWWQEVRGACRSHQLGICYMS